ncbi:MAG: TIGR02757 family protein [Acidobacteriota bacterium]
MRADPVRFPRRYVAREDREAAALVSSLFAYGNVRAMGAFLERVFFRLGPAPAAALRAGIGAEEIPPYRFQTSSDVAAFLSSAGRVLARTGTLEGFFQEGAEEGLEALSRRLRRECGRLTRGLAHLLPLPSSGSACKRWWMFLRWMVRPDDGVDLGLWSALRPSELRMPVDTHVARIALALGLARRRTPDRAFALELTDALARLHPEDPTRYDFALAHLGISRSCRGRTVESLCAACSLRGRCVLGAGGAGPRAESLPPRTRARYARTTEERHGEVQKGPGGGIR